MDTTIAAAGIPAGTVGAAEGVATGVTGAPEGVAVVVAVAVLLIDARQSGLLVPDVVAVAVAEREDDGLAGVTGAAEMLR